MERENRVDPICEIKPKGWKIIEIPNPDYPEKSLEEFIEVAQWWTDEFVETWRWLIYKGNNPRGYQCPRGLKTSDWRPEYDCWRDATNEEIQIIHEFIREGKYKDLRIVRETEYPILGKEKSKAKRIKLPISHIHKLENGWIVKKWRSGEDPLEWCGE